MDFIAKEEGFRPTRELDINHDVIGYGHNITDEENETGLVEVDGGVIDITGTITEEQGKQILNRDIQIARNTTNKYIQLVGPAFQGLETAMTSLFFNLGETKFLGTEAHKAVMRGDRETFLHEAFDPEIGFVNAGGKPMLRGRRGRELTTVQ